MLNQFRNQNGELQREKEMVLVPDDFSNTWRIKKKKVIRTFLTLQFANQSGNNSRKVLSKEV